MSVTARAPALSTLQAVERNIRERAEVVDVIVHAPLWTPSRASYRRWLCDLYGFIAPLEAKLAFAPGLAPTFMMPRNKASRIASDLLAVGLTEDEHELLLRPCSVPDFDDPVQALAWLTVVERMTWKFEGLRKKLAPRSVLGPVLTEAGSFLRTYEGTQRERWAELGREVERHAFGYQGLTRMTGFCYDCLDAIDRWMVK